MAETKVTVMPEDGSWPEGIYQIETSDPVLGYDAITDTDGPANIQWQQLANRTRYLRNKFLVGHDEEGRHLLSDDDFADSAGIKEKNIDLDYATQDLADAIAALQEDIENTFNLLEQDIHASLFGLSWSIQKLMPLSWERTGDRSAFELFTDSMHLSHGKRFHVTKSVYDSSEGIGDDSVDVNSTGWEIAISGGIEPGEWYVLCDATDSSRWQYVHVSDVLNEHRLLLEGTALHTITDGWLRPANVVDEDMHADAETCFAWISAPVRSMASEDDITVTIRHDVHTDTVPVVEYLPEGDETWLQASSYRKVATHYGEDDVCIIPRQAIPFVIRVTYQELEVPVTFSMVALVARHEYDVIEVIRRPSITASSVLSGTVSITGSTYLSLYDITQAGIEAEAAKDSLFTKVTATASSTGATVSCSIAAPQGGGYVRIRYKDIEGAYSRWSEPKAIG